MPRRSIMWLLFLSSYMPLFVLLGVRSIGHSLTLAVASGVLVVLGAFATVAVLKTARHKPTQNFKLLEVENRDADIGAYAATYLLPFLLVFDGPWRDIVSLAGFVGFLGIVYVRSRLIYVNPTLAFFGYRLWSVIPLTAGADEHTAAPWPRFLLAKVDRIAKGQVVAAHPITEDLLLFEKEVE